MLTVGCSRPDTRVPSDAELKTLAQQSSVEPGGHWAPGHCVAHNHVAIIVPYKHRSEHLKVFLAHIHPLLQRQLANYTVYVIEQVRPMLM